MSFVRTWHLLLDPDKDWTGTTSFGWQGFDAIDYSDAEVVTIKMNDESSDPAESGEWWPVVTGGTLLVISGIVTVATTLVTYKLKKCCFKKRGDDSVNRNTIRDITNTGRGSVYVTQNIELNSKQ